MHDALFASQDRWVSASDAQSVFDSLATSKGIDTSRLRDCMTRDVLRPLIQSDMERGSEAGISSTPSFIVGNITIQGAQTIESFRRAIAAVRSGQAASATPPRP